MAAAAVRDAAARHRLSGTPGLAAETRPAELRIVPAAAELSPRWGLRQPLLYLPLILTGTDFSYLLCQDILDFSQKCPLSHERLMVPSVSFMILKGNN